MSLKHIMLTGILAAGIAISPSCSIENEGEQVSPPPSFTAQSDIQYAIDSGDKDKYLKFRNHLGTYEQLYSDIRFLIKNPANDWIREQVNLDEEWINQSRGETEYDFLHAALLYATGRKEEAFEETSSLESRLGMLDLELKDRTSYLLGIMHGEKGDWLKATSYLARIDNSGKDIGKKARELLEKRGIVAITQGRFEREVMNQASQHFNGTIIVPYYDQEDPLAFLISYDSHEFAERDFLKHQKNLKTDKNGNRVLVTYDPDYIKRKGRELMFDGMIQNNPAVQIYLTEGNYLIARNIQKINENQAGQIACTIGGMIIGGVVDSPLFEPVEPYMSELPP
jgi:hypothetical protein